jgi:hypothetical protein
MSDAETLMHANLLEVFNERNPERRSAAVARTYAPDVVFSDPEGTVSGREAIYDKAQALLDGAPGFVFRPSGPVYFGPDLACLAWEFGPEGQEPVVKGVDIGSIADGVLVKVSTLVLQP